MAYEKRDMSGSIFNNARKTADNHPDRTGSCMIDGREYWINGWIKQDRNGKQFLSLAFKPKDQTDRAPAPKPAAEMDDEIPF